MEAYKELSEFCQGFDHLSMDKIHIDESDGMLIYDGDMSFKFKEWREVPSVFRHIKTINGYLCFMGCRKLENLKNLENLKYIKNYFDIDLCETLEDLDGLGNLEFVGTRIYMSECSGIKTFNGINPDVKIVGFQNVSISPEEKNIQYNEWKKSNHLKNIIDFLDGV